MNINLLPWREARKRQHALHIYNFFLVCSLLIIVMIFWLHTWLLTKNHTIPTIPATHTDHSHAIAVILRNITQHSKLIISTLSDIAQQLPLKSELSKISAANNTIKIEGNSRNMPILTMFIHHLNNLHQIKSVILKNVTEQKTIYFSIEITI